MAEIRVNATGGLKLFDADDSHYAQIIAGTITSNVDVLTLGHASADFNIPVKVLGTTPTLTIGDAGAEDTKIVFDGNAQDFYIGLDDSADDLLIGLGSAVGTTPAISINEDRDVTISDGAIDFDVASHDGTNGLKLGGTLVTSTAAELNLMDGGTSATSTTIVDADRVPLNDAGTMVQAAMSDVKSYIGGYILLNETVITSSTANVIWNNSYLTTAYKNYFITITGLTMVTDNTGLAISCSTDNGSNYNLQLYGALQGFSTDGSDNFATTSGQPNAAGAVNTIAYISNVAAEISNVEFSVYEPMNASTVTVIRMEAAQKTAGNLYDHQSGVFVASATGDMDAIKFASSSGNIATGTFRIYGVK